MSERFSIQFEPLIRSKALWIAFCFGLGGAVPLKLHPWCGNKNRVQFHCIAQFCPCWCFLNANCLSRDPCISTALNLLTFLYNASFFFSDTEGNGIGKNSIISCKSPDTYWLFPCTCQSWSLEVKCSHKPFSWDNSSCWKSSVTVIWSRWGKPASWLEKFMQVIISNTPCVPK